MNEKLNFKTNLVQYLIEAGNCELYYEKDDFKIIKLYKNTEEFLLIDKNNNVIFNYENKSQKFVSNFWEFVTKNMLSFTYNKKAIDLIINKIEGIKFSTSIFKRNLKKEIWSHIEVINNGSYITLHVFEKDFNIKDNKKWVSKNQDKKLFTMNINKSSMIENKKYGMTITFYNDISENSKMVFNEIDTYIKRYFNDYKFRM